MLYLKSSSPSLCILNAPFSCFNDFSQLNKGLTRITLKAFSLFSVHKAFTAAYVVAKCAI